MKSLLAQLISADEMLAAAMSGDRLPPEEFVDAAAAVEQFMDVSEFVSQSINDSIRDDRESAAAGAGYMMALMHVERALRERDKKKQ